MITSYEVGASFVLEDRTSGELSRMADILTSVDASVKRVQESLEQLGTQGFAELTRGVAALSNEMQSMSGAATRMADSFRAGMDSAKSAVTGVINELTRMNTLAEGAASRAGVPGFIRPGGRVSESEGGGGVPGFIRPSVGGGSGGGRGGGNFPGFLPFPRPLAPDEQRRRDAAEQERARRRAMVATRRGNGGILSGMEPLIEGGTVYEAMHSAMSEELSIAQALYNMNIDPNSPEGQRAAQTMRGAAASAARGTIYSERSSAAAMPIVAAELGFGGGEGLQKFGQVFPSILRMAEMAQMMGMGDMTGSLRAGIEFAHMTGRYEPAALSSGLNTLFAVSRSVGRSPEEEEQILKYAVPLGKAAGAGADQTAMAVGFLQQMGFNTTTAGTGLAQLILGTLTGDGAGRTQHQQSLRSQLEAALHGHDPHARAVGNSRQHTAALRALGIEGADGKLTVTDAAGNLDLMAVLRDIAEFAKAHKPQELLNTLKEAFGLRGERVASVMSDPAAIERLERYLSFVGNAPDITGMQKGLAQTGMQQFEQTLARLNDIGNTLATGTLPAFNSVLVGINTTLQAMNNWLASHPAIATGVGTAAGVGLTGAALGIGARVLGFGGGAAAGAAAGAAGGAVEGGIAAGLAGMFTAALGSPLVIAAVVAGVGALFAKAIADAYGQTRAPDSVSVGPDGKLIPKPTLKGFDIPNPDKDIKNFLGGSDGTSHPGVKVPAEGGSHQLLGPGQGGVTVHGDINVHGAPHDSDYAWVDNIMGKLAARLSDAQQHNLGDGYGSFASPYTSGIG